MSDSQARTIAALLAGVAAESKNQAGRVGINGRAFVTGSHAYGTPTKASDVDLVIEITPEALAILEDLADAQKSGGSAGCRHTTPLRFGLLNLLCCRHADAYVAWQKGTEELIERKPVTRGEAIEVFTRLFGEAFPEPEAFPLEGGAS